MSKQKEETINQKCEECGYTLSRAYQATGRPNYKCPNCGKYICNRCAQIAAKNSYATVACPFCGTDVRYGRIY